MLSQMPNNPTSKNRVIIRRWQEIIKSNVSKDSEIHDLDMVSNHFLVPKNFMLFLEETWAIHVPLRTTRKEMSKQNPNFFFFFFFHQTKNSYAIVRLGFFFIKSLILFFSREHEKKWNRLTGLQVIGKLIVFLSFFSFLNRCLHLRLYDVWVLENLHDVKSVFRLTFVSALFEKRIILARFIVTFLWKNEVKKKVILDETLVIRFFLKFRMLNRESSQISIII